MLFGLDGESEFIDRPLCKEAQRRPRQYSPQDGRGPLIMSLIPVGGIEPRPPISILKAAGGYHLLDMDVSVPPFAPVRYEENFHELRRAAIMVSAFFSAIRGVAGR
jgi:hypothetical protein